MTSFGPEEGVEMGAKTKIEKVFWENDSEREGKERKGDGEKQILRKAKRDTDRETQNREKTVSEMREREKEW